MWILTYEVNDYRQHGEYHQFSWFVKPEVVYLACYLKHIGLVAGESWDIRCVAEKLHEGLAVQIGYRIFKLWEQEHPGQLEMY